MSKHRTTRLFERELVAEALKQSFIKLNPRILFRNPVMFTVEIGCIIMLGVCLWILSGNRSQGSLSYNILVFAILFITILFANFAEALAEAHTALHLIGMARWADRHVSCADLLIQLGASASQRDNEGLTPIDVYIGAMQRQFRYIDGSFGRALAATLPDEERRHVDGRLAGVMTMVRKKQRIKRNSIEHNR